MKRKFAREHNYSDFTKNIEKRFVGVLSLGEGCGATFFALNLAQELESRGMSTAFLELPEHREGKSLIYHMMDMDRRLGLKRYRSVMGEAENNREIKARQNIEAGINWALVHPEESMRNIGLSTVQEARVIHNLSGDYIICDMGCRYRESRIAEMDMLFCIIDPMPSKLIAAREMYHNLVKGEKKIVWVLNKDNGGIQRKCFYDYMKVKGHERIPMLDPELFYKAEYNCRLPYEQNEIRHIMKPIMENIVNRHILITNG